VVVTDQYYSTEYRRRFPLMDADQHSCRFAPNRFKVAPGIEFLAPDAGRSARKSASRPDLQILAANFANEHELNESVAGSGSQEENYQKYSPQRTQRSLRNKTEMNPVGYAGKNSCCYRAPSPSQAQGSGI
jgi:hypothetical protein